MYFETDRFLISKFINLSKFKQKNAYNKNLIFPVVIKYNFNRGV